MAQKVDLQERLKMRFLTVDYDGKNESYAGYTYDAGTIVALSKELPEEKRIVFTRE